MKSHPYIVRGKKVVTVGKGGTIEKGALVVEDKKIVAVGSFEELREQYPSLSVIDYSDCVITPSLVDCHTHLLEFAPTSLYPSESIDHFAVGKELLLDALSAGITALGEQICGHPLNHFSVTDYRQAIEGMPMDVSFATASISIGFEQLAHYTAITQSRSVEKKELIEPKIVQLIAQASDYPGENIFINATPANFSKGEVPRAGEIIYTLEELKQVVAIYHQAGKQIGAHVAGEKALEMALEAGIDVLHHAHGITDQLIEKAATNQVKIVATPMGGTHLQPNSPEEILKLVAKGIAVSISTDAYLPPYSGAPWLPFQDQRLKGPDVLMLIASPTMRLLKKHNYDENEILALLTAHPAEIVEKEDRFGRLEPGLDANFLVAEGIPGLEITEIEKIKKVFFRGEKVMDREG